MWLGVPFQTPKGRLASWGVKFEINLHFLPQLYSVCHSVSFESEFTVEVLGDDRMPLPNNFWTHKYKPLWACSGLGALLLIDCE